MSEIVAHREFYNRYWLAFEYFGSYKIQRVGRILIVLDDLRKQLGELRILDLGCGDGRAVATWNLVGSASGLDLSSAAMEAAAKLFPTIEFIAADATSTGLSSGVYNVIVSQEVIEHIIDQKAYITECHRLLGPSGFLILTTPNRYFFDNRKGGNYSRQPVENLLDATELRTLLSPYFKVVHFSSLLVANGDYGWYRFFSSQVAVFMFDRIGLFKLRKWIMERIGLGVSLFVIAKRLP